MEAGVSDPEDGWNRTYYPTGKDVANETKPWYIVDAEGQTLGRLATLVAMHIRYENAGGGGGGEVVVVCSGVVWPSLTWKTLAENPLQQALLYNQQYSHPHTPTQTLSQTGVSTYQHTAHQWTWGAM